MSIIPESTRHLQIGSLIFPKLDLSQARYRGTGLGLNKYPTRWTGADGAFQLNERIACSIASSHSV